MRIEIVPRHALASARYCEALELCVHAYDADEDIVCIMRQFDRSTHVLLIDAHERLVSHALWIERWLIHRANRIRSAYVELVATDPKHQRHGHASAVMRALGQAFVGFDIGALSPSDPAFMPDLDGRHGAGRCSSSAQTAKRRALPPTKR